MKAYHFTSETLRNGHVIPAKGRWLTHSGHIVPCEIGLHASVHPFDALKYAPGPFLHYVELDGELVSHGEPVDKWAGRRRKIIASVDATPLLWTFARHAALEVAHLWDAPDVVLEYLFTGREDLRDAARDAARAVAWAAAWAAARAAARDAAWAAARDAAWAAQRLHFAELVATAFREEGVNVEELGTPNEAGISGIVVKEGK